MRAKTKKATFYLKDNVHQALKLKAALTGRSLSELTNEALEQASAEDLADITSLKERSSGPSETYEAFLAGLKADGLI
ncbi:CopG family transcriptional regulator [Candidatus Parcubacteria bacterium]|nr:CopG family transcriptional regulator [Candidatus Parcubacteria bacterium]